MLKLQRSWAFELLSLIQTCYMPRYIEILVVQKSVMNFECILYITNKLPQSQDGFVV